jgi:hypothetical protein
MKTKQGSIFLFFSLMVIALVACGGTQAVAGTANPNPNSDTQPTTSIAIPTEEVEFDLSTASHVPPQDVLQEVTYYVGGGGGPCVGIQEGSQPVIAIDPSDEELALTSRFVSCGWEKDLWISDLLSRPR